ncbi:MAG: hypothetical protein ACFFBC_05965 [Promethearchaeota archaeon]
MIIKKPKIKAKNRIKFLIIFITTLIIPTIISSPIFSNFMRNINKLTEEEDFTNTSDLLVSSSTIPNANNFEYFKIITIDHTKVNGSGNHVNFPLLISIIDSDLDDKAQFDGDDIAFANSTSWLDHEIERYDPSYSATEAQLIAWVRIPLLSASIDTKIFMFYGNSTIGNQENPTGVWDSNYKGVWHLKEDPDLGFPGDIKDSTSNGNHATAYNMESTDMQEGPIGTSFTFNGWNEYLSVGNVGPELINTIEFWMNTDSLSSYDSYNTGYHSPTATGNYYTQWTNPTGAYASDDNRASEQTNYEDQDWYNFSFSIPAGVTINGIVVSIEGSSSQFGEYVSCRVRLSGDGGNSYTYYKTPQSWSSTYDYSRTVGSSSDTWGESWSVSNFSNSNFRVWLEKTGSYYASLRVDHIQIRVYYSTSSDTTVIDLDGTDQISIDANNGDIKPVSFSGITDIYINGVNSSTVTTGVWYHVVITDTTGISASSLDIARNLSVYYDGAIDEFRLSSMLRSSDWIATEYNNQESPNNFYSVGVEKTSLTDLEVNAIDLYGNPIPNVNISMYENSNLIRSDIADSSGTVVFDDFLSIDDEFNFTIYMTSNVAPYHTIIINKTNEAILIEGAVQIINLICNISRNIFNIVDIDGIPLDSGWVEVGNSTDLLQNCTIDSTGHATFRWLNKTPYEYNYTVWYRDSIYNPKEIEIASGDIFIPDSDVNVTVLLTTVNFTVITHTYPNTPIDGAKISLDKFSGENIVNLTTNLNGNATLRWGNSSVINSNYFLTVSFYGVIWTFEIPELMTGIVSETNFTVNAMAAYTIELYFEPGELEEAETKIVSLNPTSNIITKWGTNIKVRALFNVTKVPSGAAVSIGPTYADSMSCQIFQGTTFIHSYNMIAEDDYIGRHQGIIETVELEPNIPYIIQISAQKSGYVLPSEMIMSLLLSEHELILNQSQNDDSPLSVYWAEDINMSVTPYGKISEDFIIEHELYNNIDPTTFKFSIPEIQTNWNLSGILFDIYDITWNTDVSNINITIEDPYGGFHMFHNSNHSGWDWAQGSWKGIYLNLEKESLTQDNNFEFIIGGSFDDPVDIVAEAYFLRDKINTQHNRFNITDIISLSATAEGWAVKNITFELYNCRNTSSGSLIDPLSDVNLNISTNEDVKYSLESGGLGFGSLTIDNRIIYPLNDQFLFTIENLPEVIFDVLMKVEYTQEFYQNNFLEIKNITKTEYSINNGGTFQVSVTSEDWDEDQSILLITEITDGIDYFLPSQRGMTITIDGSPYSISDVSLGQGMVLLDDLAKNTIYTAVIDTAQPTIFNLNRRIDYSRQVTYKTKGIVTYSVIENPTVYGTVQFHEGLECYLQPINTSLFDADDYTIQFTIVKENYITAIKELDLFVLERLTLLNSSSGFFRSVENIDVQDAVNFTFLYTDALNGTKITDLTSYMYVWEKYDGDGNVVDSGQGTLTSTVDNLYILDFNTENLTVGEYLLLITIGKTNYEFKNAMISLTVNKRIIDHYIRYNNRIISNNRINIDKGKTASIEILLTDPTRGDIPLIDATIVVQIGGEEIPIDFIGNGTYRFDFPTDNIDTFFSSKTLTGIINISKYDYHSKEFTITIVVGMEEFIFGIPTFYFILIVSAIVGIGGSIVGYRVYKNAKIPNFVKKVRSMKKAIEGEKSIPESLLYRDKEIYVGEQVQSMWDNIGLSIGASFGIELKKKGSKVGKKISEVVKRREIRPIGLVLMRWNVRVGTEILTKYPEDTDISEKTLMQIYSTHEYSGEKGAITLTAGLLNVLSYYTGPDPGYYVILLLKSEDDPDVYEGAMPDISRIIIENIENDSYLYMLPSLFQRLSLYPSLSDEEILALTYQDEVKRMIINSLRDIGLITKSELTIWLKDKYHEGFIDFEAILLELLKKDLIKQVSVKGLESELIMLTNDFFMLRVPPVKLIASPTNYGLPSQFTKEYLSEIKEFFQGYHPTGEDNLSMLNIFVNSEAYELLRLLRSAIVTRQDLEKLKVKGVEDIYGTLKLLWDNKMIRVFRDEKNIEYYALITDFYMDLLFPKYLLKVIKSSYEQKSISRKALIEYLRVLEEAYYNSKSREKSKKSKEIKK